MQFMLFKNFIKIINTKTPQHSHNIICFRIQYNLNQVPNKSKLNLVVN